MWARLLFDAAVAALLMAGWYFGWREVNRLKAERILSRVREAVAGRAGVSGACWRSASRFDVELRFSAVFRESWLSVDFIPREMPIHWLMASLGKQTEQVTFRAELEHRPTTNLIVANQRWGGRTSKAAALPDECYSLGMLVITTREDWQSETAIIEGILAARSNEPIQVEFRRKSPHLLVTAPLSSLTQDEDDPGLFGLLQELATCRAARKE
jgi:hypothetical protein